MSVKELGGAAATACPICAETFVDERAFTNHLGAIHNLWDDPGAGGAPAPAAPPVHGGGADEPSGPESEPAPAGPGPAEPARAEGQEPPKPAVRRTYSRGRKAAMRVAGAVFGANAVAVALVVAVNSVPDPTRPLIVDGEVVSREGDGAWARSAALRVHEMPAGWRISNHYEITSRPGDHVDDIELGRAVDECFNSRGARGPSSPHGEADFLFGDSSLLTPTSSFAWLGQGTVVFGSLDAAQRELGAMPEALACAVDAHAKVPADGEPPAPGPIETLDVGPAGTGRGMTMTAGGAPARVDIVGVREGRMVSYFVAYQSGRVDRQLITPVVQVGTAKLGPVRPGNSSVA